MTNFLIVSTQVWVLFALVALGAAARLAKLVDDAAVKGIVNILVLLVTPSLIIDVFQRPYEAAMLRQLGVAFAIAFAAHVVAIAAASLIVRSGDDSRRPVLRLAIVFSNAGFMGIPLEHAILGDSGVFFGITYVVTFNLVIWSWGLWEMNSAKCTVENAGNGAKSRDRRPSAARRPSSMIRNSSFIVNPGTIGMAAGLGLFLAGATLPQILAQPVKMMASLNTPLAMIVIGYYLAGAKFGRVIRCREAYVATFVRLVAFPAALLAALYPFRKALDSDMMLALVIAASAPVAAMVTMFSAKFGRDVDLSVGLVSGTTLLSIITMPAIIALALEVLKV